MQGDLRLGIDVAARELTADELAAKEVFFGLAAHFALQLTRVRNQQFREIGIESVVAYEPPHDVVVDALKLIAYEPDQQIVLDASVHPAQKAEQRILQLIAAFAADTVKLAVQHLSRAELLERVRVLARTPLEEDADAATDRLDAIYQLLGGHNSAYVGEVLERVERIITRDSLGYQGYDVGMKSGIDRIVLDLKEAFTEALTVGR